MGWSREHGVQPRPEVMHIRDRWQPPWKGKGKNTPGGEELTGWGATSNMWLSFQSVMQANGLMLVRTLPNQANDGRVDTPRQPDFYLALMAIISSSLMFVKDSLGTR